MLAESEVTAAAAFVPGSVGYESVISRIDGRSGRARWSGSHAHLLILDRFGFCHTHVWPDDFALFMAVKDAHGQVNGSGDAIAARNSRGDGAVVWRG